MGLVCGTLVRRLIRCAAAGLYYPTDDESILTHEKAETNEKYIE